MKVKFQPTGQEVDADPNKTLLQICIENQIPINSICKGVPSCAECRVHIVQGEHNTAPPTPTELSLIGSSYYLDGRRLSCQVRCFGDVTVDIAEQIDRSLNQKKKTRGFQRAGSNVGDTHAVQGTLVLEENTKKSR